MISLRLRLARTLALALAVAAPVDAALAADPALFQDLHWRMIGPFRGGRVLAVSGVPGEPEHFYFGSVNGGVWESRDAGRTWKPIFDSQPIGSIGALAVAPSNPRVLYVGSGEADMRSDIAQGDGMYKSVDGGATWTHLGLRDSQQIGRIVVDPQNSDLLYVAALGHPYGPNPERGVYRSRDGGATFEKILGPDDATGAIDLALEPGNPRVIYAALWQARRTPWSIYPPASGPGSGLYKSTDGGDSWKPVRGGGFPAAPKRIGVRVAPSEPRRVYAVVDAEKDGGLYRSDDAGATWRRTSADPRIWERGWYFGGLAVEPRDPDVVYSCNVNLYRSSNGGVNFTPVKGAPGGDDYHEMWIDPEHPERRILGVDQGAVVSTNGGATWSSWFNQPTAQFYHVSTDDRFPYRVYGAQQDSGAAGVPSRNSSYNGITLGDFREVTAGGENDNIAPDPKDPDILFGGRVERLDLRTGQTRSVDPTLAHLDQYRRTWTLPLVFSRRDPRVLYFANQRVFRSADGGESWTIISPDLTREDPGAPANLDAITAANNTGQKRRGVVYAIAPSRRVARDLWAGTDDGLIWRTRDEGEHWQNVTPPELTAWSKVGILEASPHDAETAYAAIDRHRLDDFAAYVYRTHDGGVSWQLAAEGIPHGSFVNAVREDPVRKGLLYAGTEKGVYVSFDDGDHWQSLQLNLPVTSVRDLEVKDRDLVIATHGRSFWILDDLTPLRQLGQAEGQAAWLYTPATAVRMRPAGFTGTPMPLDEPRGENPPSGVYIDYYLARPASGAVTLEIRNARGTVRAYSSDDAPKKANPLKVRTAPEWPRAPSTLSAAAGMHRFVWPLRYAPPPELANGDPYAEGLWAPPGSYSAVLWVDGKEMTVPFSVVPDPRIDLPQSAYDAQLALGREIETLRARLAAATESIDDAAKAIRERRGSLQPELTSRLDAWLDRAAKLSGGTLPSDEASWFIPPRGVDTLRFVSGHLSSLAEAVDGADAAPSPDARSGFAELRPKAEALLVTRQSLAREWQELARLLEASQ
jgi:photosystem II stability/assembly factor-like uncharacterized protein